MCITSHSFSRFYALALASYTLHPVPGPSSSKSGLSKKLRAKKARRVLTLEEKYKVVEALSKVKKQAKVTKLFDPPLSQSTVATIAKNEKQIISTYKGGMCKSKRKMLEELTYPEWIKHHQNGLKK